MSKLELRRIQMLVRQRERLEEELAALQKEMDELVYPLLYVSTSSIEILLPGASSNEKMIWIIVCHL